MIVMHWLLVCPRLGRLGISASPSGFVMTLCRLVYTCDALSVLDTGKPVLSAGANLITSLGKLFAPTVGTLDGTTKVGVLEFGA